MDINGGNMVRYIRAKQEPNVKVGQSTPVVGVENKPNIAIEVFLSLVKWFLIFIVINNLIWAGIYSYTLNKASSDTMSSTEVWQDGTNNKQSVING